MICTTLNKIREHSPCADGWEKLLKHLGKIQADDEPLPLATILASNGLDDALWCLRTVPEHDRLWRKYAVWCARQVQHLMTDQRSIAALDIADRHADGLATDAELDAAGAAAWDAAWAADRAAAWAADWAAARDAAWAAAGDAARDAAGDAAGAAARDAAWAAAWAADRAAAWAAAWAAARDAAWAADWAATRAAQTAELLRIVTNGRDAEKMEQARSDAADMLAEVRRD